MYYTYKISFLFEWYRFRSIYRFIWTTQIKTCLFMSVNLYREGCFYSSNEFSSILNFVWFNYQINKWMRFKYRGLSTELYFAWHNNIYENIERKNRESVVCKVYMRRKITTSSSFCSFCEQFLYPSKRVYKFSST